MQYCSRCVYPEIAVNVILDDEGVCSACRVAEEFAKLTPDYWTARKQKFEQIVEWVRTAQRGDYHCIIPVSGGKDSYFQTYMIKEVYGLNPLLVTYHGNNYLPEGQGNLDRMRDAFDVDHIVYGPGIGTLKKLNRLCFRKMGDMNWHAHCGIKFAPMRLACRLRIPLVVWGETTWSIAGMFSPDDYVEYNKRTVAEHDLRGFTWRDMIGGEEGLTEDNLIWAKPPGDDELERVGVRGIYIGNFFNWDPNQHAKLMHEKYGFEFARQTFERTYRTMSNLDDMHENGIHDYMKFVKFGYGRASDHAAKDIRQGYMTREQGVEMVRRHDHIKPRDLTRWLDYVGMTESEFDQIADGFRDPRVWRRDGGRWVKDNIWDEAATLCASGVDE